MALAQTCGTKYPAELTRDELVVAPRTDVMPRRLTTARREPLYPVSGKARGVDTCPGNVRRVRQKSTVVVGKIRLCKGH